jgi:hypothetical protein
MKSCSWLLGGRTSRSTLGSILGNERRRVTVVASGRGERRECRERRAELPLDGKRWAVIDRLMTGPPALALPGSIRPEPAAMSESRRSSLRVRTSSRPLKTAREDADSIDPPLRRAGMRPSPPRRPCVAGSGSIARNGSARSTRVVPWPPSVPHSVGDLLRSLRPAEVTNRRQISAEYRSGHRNRRRRNQFPH